MFGSRHHSLFWKTMKNHKDKTNLQKLDFESESRELLTPKDSTFN